MPLSTGWPWPTKNRGGTVVPCGTGNPCHFSVLSMPKASPRSVQLGMVPGLPSSVWSGPGLVLDRSDPRSVPLPLFGLRSRPIRSGPGPNYTPMGHYRFGIKVKFWFSWMGYGVWGVNKRVRRLVIKVIIAVKYHCIIRDHSYWTYHCNNGVSLHC